MQKFNKLPPITARGSVPVNIPENLKMLGDRVVDINMMGTFARYFWYGLDPGSFGMYCILGDYHKALGIAGDNMKPWAEGSSGAKVLGPQNPTQNMIDILKETIPSYALGPDNYLKWIRHIGVQGSSLAMQVQVKLIMNEFWWSEVQGVTYGADLGTREGNLS